MKTTVDTETDRAFFARLGLAFAVSILVSGIMMVAVSPVPQDSEGTQLALNMRGEALVAGR